MQTVLEELAYVNSIWKELGLALGLKIGKLNDIKRDENSEGDRMIATIDTWLRSGGQATWKGLIMALNSRRVGEGALAKTIEQKVVLQKL